VVIPKLNRGSDRTSGASIKTGTDTKNIDAANAHHACFLAFLAEISCTISATVSTSDERRLVFVVPGGTGRIMGAGAVYKVNVRSTNLILKFVTYFNLIQYITT
jgi:hypothetical protein